MRFVDRARALACAGRDRKIERPLLALFHTYSRVECMQKAGGLKSELTLDFGVVLGSYFYMQKTTAWSSTEKS